MPHVRILLVFSIAAVLFCSGCGPRMRDQMSVKPYEKKMPAMSPDVVPTSGTLTTLAEQQSRSANPVRATETVLKNGRIYYGYYCVACHGARGDGNGPVGQSYVPKPTDLSTGRVTGMADGQLYIRMLRGVGHAPVLEQTVLPEHRWPLVAYVRTFEGREGETPTAQPGPVGPPGIGTTPLRPQQPTR